MSWCALLSVGPSSCSRVHSRASAMPLSPMTMIEMPTAASMYVENRSTLSAPLTAKASAPTSAWWTEAEESATLVAMTARPVARSLPLREMSRQARPEEAQGPRGGTLSMLAHRTDPVAQPPVEPCVDGHPPAEETAASEARVRVRVRVRARAKGRARESHR
jgi:hypothetical protein